MTVAPGSRVGSFEILELVGSGGMGEVYRAHDPRLGRDVAIKVIPASFAADPDRVRRFEQEARAAAALTHPNILAVHDVGTHESAPYIVSELLRGMTLREGTNGGALPVRKAIDIAVQVARGLAAAHQKNIVHRDLKPENVFVTDDGMVKILDFGLAKLTEVEAGPAENAVTRQAGTQPGMVMGTAGYMSPEQLRAQPVDARSDIFSFGAMVYELLAGARAFRGESSMDVATAILKEDPADLPADRRVPPALTRIVKRCLEKNPSARFQSAGDLAFALEALLSPSGTTEALLAVEGRRRRAIPWLAAAAAGLVVGGAATYSAVRILAPAPTEAVPIEFPLTIPEGVAFVAGGPTGSSPAPLAISPDGRQLAFLGIGSNGARMLWVRSLSATVPRMIPGTEGAWSPFWSADSKQIGFNVTGSGKLKRVDVAGGAPVEICDVRNFLGGSWNRDGVIIFGTNLPATRTGIQRVPATGGTPTAATTVGEDEGLHSRPIFLPDGRHFVFRVLAQNQPRGWLYLASIDSPERRRLVETESSNTSYSAGHLLYLRGQTLMAHPFDASNLVLSGDAFPVVPSVQAFGGVPAGVFSASENGVLAYQTGSLTSGMELRWFSRAGTLQGRVGEAGFISDLAMSRDGTRVAYSRRAEATSAESDIWIADTTSGLTSRLTFDSGSETAAVFSPDGRHVAFNSSRKGNRNLYQKASDGSGEDIELLVDEYNKAPIDWSPDGRYLLYVATQAGPRTSSVPGAVGPRPRLWILPLQGDRTPRLLLREEGAQPHGSFSPDGRFVAYAGNPGGSQNEIFVTPFPATGPKWQISTAGGTNPVWSRDGKEIFFSTSSVGTRHLAAARVDATGPALKVEEVKTLFPITLGTPGSAYAPTRDGQRFLINIPAGNDPRPASPPVIVTDWPALRREGK